MLSKNELFFGICVGVAFGFGWQILDVDDNIIIFYDICMTLYKLLTLVGSTHDGRGATSSC